MNFKLLLSALRARYRIFFLILLVTVTTTAIVSLVVPKSYVSKVSLLLDGKDEQSMRSTNNAPSERERAGYMQTQVDIITSPKVARRVINDLNLAENEEAREDFKASGSIGSIVDWLAEGLGQQVKVDTSQSSLIQIAFSSPNPHFSALVANAYARAYVDTVLELRVEPTRQTSIWFDEQLKGLRDNMEQAEGRLTNFQLEHGIVANDERYDVESIQLSNLAGLLAGVREIGSTIRGNRSSGAALESQPEIIANPGIQRLRADLLRAEAKLQEASVNFGSRHPQYLRQLAEVNGLRQQVDGEIRNFATSVERSAERSLQRKNKLVSEMAAQRERVLGLRQARNQLAMLSHDVDIAQRTYDTAMQRFMASKIESRALQTNVSILDHAVPPTDPARPKILLNIALAIVIGVLLGLAAVHLLEMSDHRIRMLDDLDGDPRVPLLAVLSNEDPATDRLIGSPGSRNALPAPG